MARSGLPTTGSRPDECNVAISMIGGSRAELRHLNRARFAFELLTARALAAGIIAARLYLRTGLGTDVTKAGFERPEEYTPVVFELLANVGIVEILRIAIQEAALDRTVSIQVG